MYKTKQGEYKTLTQVTDAMLEFCEHPEAHENAAGFGHSRTNELMEFVSPTLNHETDEYDLEAAAKAYDNYLAS